MWTDINNVDVAYEDNFVTGNRGYGILHEISYRARIRDNVVLDNRSQDNTAFYGGGQIVVSASPDVEVSGNKVRGVDGIGILQQERRDFPSTLGPHEARNVYVHHNELTETTRAGVIAGMAADELAMFMTWNNRFVANVYHLPDPSGRYFDWLSRRRTASEWRGLAQDTSGVFNIGTGPPAPGPPSPAKSVASSAVAIVDVPAAGIYRIWTRLSSPDGGGTSYALQIGDGQAVRVAGVSGRAWTWVDHRDGDPSSKVDIRLTAGRHAVRLTGQDGDVAIDQLLLTTDLGCVPAGAGDNCT